MGEYSRGIQDLESIASYPLGDDSFKIDHGQNYFSYFERMGEVHTCVADDGHCVVATGTGVLRSWPAGAMGDKEFRAWYLCDLKVHPEYRGRHLPLAMLRRSFLRRYLMCRRGFGVSMNPKNKPNPVLRLLERFKWARFKAGPQLRIYSLTYDEILKIEPLLRRHRGPVSFLSLKGTKDLILQSTNEPLELLHAQFGPRGAARAGINATLQTLAGRPLRGATHMFCAPENDVLAMDLERENLSFTATATIIHHRMDDVDWKFLPTSDI
jgi:hypothetical protein